MDWMSRVFISGLNPDSFRIFVVQTVEARELCCCGSVVVCMAPEAAPETRDIGRDGGKLTGIGRVDCSAKETGTAIFSWKR